MPSNQIRAKTNQLASLRRAISVLQKNSIDISDSSVTTIQQQHDEIISLCVTEIQNPTNPDDFISACCKLARSHKSTLRSIAEKKIKAKTELPVE